MKIRVTFPSLFIFLAILLLGLQALLNQQSYDGLIRTNQDEQFKLMESIVRFNIKGGLSKALARAEMFADTPEVAQALKKHDRKALLAATQPVFEHQQAKYGVAQAQFSIPPHHMFLRVQKPGSFGDDLSSFRYTVMAAYADKKNISGVEISRSGPAIFGVVPMMDRKQMYGAVELGMEFGPILDGLKSAYGFDLTFFVDQKMLLETATLFDKTRINPENAIGSFQNFHSTDWKRMRGLIDNDKLEHLKEVRTYTGNFDNQAYGVVVIPVQDFNKRIIGYIAAFKNFEAAYSSQRHFMILQLVLSMISIVLLAGVVIVMLKGGLISPIIRLTGHLNALADGEESELEPDSFSSDLQPLVHAAKRLHNGREEDA